VSKIESVAILGTGVIGASWSALFLSAGFKVRACDPADSDGSRLRAYIDSAWPALSTLEMTTNRNPDNITLHASAAEAVSEAQFVQESIPERLELKHQLYAEIEPALLPDAIVASSASGLLVSEMQRGVP
jgi:carnitine 3-dehydrogenase